MAVRLKELSVKALGPLPAFTMQFRDLNLIYGRNEAGKTYLVEFILRSVFQETRDWSLRPETGEGKVVLTGLGAEPVTFSPESRRKLEEYWSSGEAGLPAKMGNLLVVKGAEIALVKDQPGGINRAILKSYLSRDVLLEQIQGKISATVKKARVLDGEVDGENKGDIKQRRQSVEQLDGIERLFSEIEERYSGGPRRELEQRQEMQSQQVNQLTKAKQHLACRLGQEIEALGQRRGTIPDVELESLKRGLDAYQRDLGRLAEREEQQRALGKEAAEYTWIENAIGVWDSRQLDRVVRVGWPLLALGGLLIVGGLIALVARIGPVALGLILAVAGVALAALHIYRLYQQLHLSPESDELRRLSQDFEVRFGEKLVSLAELKRREAALRERHYKARTLQDDCEKDRTAIEEQAAELAGQARVLFGKDVPLESLADLIAGVETDVKGLERKLNELRVERAALAVDEHEYETADPGVEFDPSRLNALEAELAQTNRELQAMQAGLDNLKQSICSETGKGISISWPDLLEQLRLHRQRVIDEYKSLTAGLLAQILVNGVLVDVRAQEVEGIRRGLRGPQLLAALKKVTGRYEALDIQDDELVVSDAYSSYPLPGLSTGAQEQVLLAVRMGFASVLAGGQPLFVILDDAFQHSDWLRRELLVEEVVRLAKDGWQVTYLTMDDHLKGLFRKEGEKHFGESFSFAEI